MKKFITSSLLLLLLGVALPIQAQEKAEKVKVTGTVVEQETSEGVPFCKVSLSIITPQDTVVYGQISDDRGRFAITVPLVKQVLLEIEALGRQKISQSFPLQSGEKTHALGKIEMVEDVTMLSEVEVVERVQLVDLQSDRIGYAIDKDPEAASQNLISMLRKVPLVTVDAQDNIQVKGSSRFKILLNGKPNPMFDSNPKMVLQSIPAATVKKIEVITDPGVKYDAEGVTAIINIITPTTSSTDGVMGNVGIEVGTPLKASTNAYLMLKKGKFGMTFNGVYSYQRNHNNMSVNMFRNNLLSHREQQNMTQRSNFMLGNLLLSYEIDENNLLTLNANVMPIPIRVETNTAVDRIDQGVKFDKHETIMMNQAGTMNTSVDYQHTFNKPGELLIASYRYAGTPSSSEQNTEIEALKQFSRMKSKTGLNEHTSQIDYTLPFGKHLIETGAKYIYRNGFSKPNYEILDPSTNQWIPGSYFASAEAMKSLDHTYNIVAGYLGYTLKTNKYSFKAGVRGEGSHVVAKYLEDPSSFLDTKFLNFIPRISFGYNPTPMIQLKIGYGESIKRPTINQLNPTELKVSDLYISSGNPDLDAIRTRDIDFSLTHMGQKHMLSLSSTYSFINNNVENIIYNDPSRGNLLINTFENLGRFRSLYLHLYAQYTPTKWLRLMCNSNITFKHRDAITNPIINGIPTTFSRAEFNSKFLFMVLMAYFTLPKNFNFNINGMYINPGEMIQTKQSDYFMNSFSLSKGFMNNRLNVSLSVNSPFKQNLTMDMTSIIDAHNRTEQHISVPMRGVTLGIMYRFGALNGQVKKTVKSIVNDDRLEIKQSQAGSSVQGGSQQGNN